MKKALFISIVLFLWIGSSWGQVTVSNAVSGNGTYTTLTGVGGAFAAINGAAQTNANIVITITGNITTEDATNGLNAGTWSSLKIVTDGTWTVSGGVAAALIKLNGAGHVTIDGRIGQTGTNKSLKFVNTSVTSLASTIYIGDGAHYNTLQYIVVAGASTQWDAGNIILGGTTSNYLTIQNCDVEAIDGANRPNYGININSDQAVGISIKNCKISNFNNYGISGAYFLGIEILNNEIYQTIASTGDDVEGICLYSNYNSSSSMSVSGNKIYGLDGPTNGYLSGINISGGTTSTGTIYNNAISINSVQSIYIDGINVYGWGSTYNIYHNSVYIGGTEQGTNSSHAFFSTNSECVLNIKNNVFFNNRINNGGTGVHYAIHRYYTTGFVANYNDYFINGASSYIGKYNGSDVATLAAWRTATSQDASSISANPLFTSTTNLKPITGTPLNLAGTPLTEVPKDINDTTRNATTPTIGAYELTYMSGTYTVGTGGNYPSLTGEGGFFQAVNNSYVNGNITASIVSDLTEPGTYALNQLTKVGGNYTFAIVPGSASLKTISGSKDGALIQLNGADSITIDGRYNQTGTSKYLKFVNTSATYSAASIEISNGAHYNTIQYSVVASASKGWDLGNIALDGTTCNYLTIQYCDIIGIDGANRPLTSVSINSDQAVGTIIKNCKISNFNNYGIYAQNFTGIEVYNNEIYQTVASPESYLTGIYLSNYYNSPISISGNRIYGLDAPNGDYLSGIEIWEGSELSTVNIYNNAISINSLSYLQIEGIFVYGNSSTFNLNFNSVYIGGACTEYSSNSNAFNNGNGASVYNLKNNVFFNDRINIGGSGVHYAINMGGASSFVANYNEYFVNGASSYLGYYNGTDITTLAAWRTATGQDANSISVNPLISTSGMQPFQGSPLLGAGTTISGITKDVLDNTRNVTTPTIGAYENAILPMNGTYTIGNGGNYPSLTGEGGFFQAINATCINGNITASIISDLTEDGAYALNQLVKVGGSYTFTIIPSSATLKNINGSIDAGLIRLNGADSISIDGRYNQTGTDKYLKFVNTSTSEFASTIQIFNKAHYNTIRNAVILGASRNTDPNTYHGANIVIGYNKDIDTNFYNTIQYCDIANVDGTNQPCRTIAGNSAESPININHCSVYDFKDYGLYLYNASGSEITYNSIFQTIPSSSNYTCGISFLGMSDLPITISNNKIYDLDSPYGIAGLDVWNSNSSKISIINNSISINQVSSSLYTVYGVHFAGDASDSVMFLNNSINMVGGKTSSSWWVSYGFYSENPNSNLVVKNNVISQTMSDLGGGNGDITAVFFSSQNSIVSDFNDLYAPTEPLIRYHNDYYQTLNDWKIVLGMDNSSISANPLFTSTTNLKPITGTPLNLAGTPLVAVPKDINDSTRNATTPTIGAYEYALPYMNGVYTVGTGGNYPSLTGEGGFFQAVNNSYVNGNITASIVSDLTEPGTYALNQLTKVGGNYTFAIAPGSASLKTISGTKDGGLIRLNGADSITIDGRYNQTGTSKYLKFVNTSATSLASTIYIGDGAHYNTLQYIVVAGASTQWDAGNIILGGTTSNYLTIQNCDVEAIDGANRPNCGININSDQAVGISIKNCKISNFNLYGISGYDFLDIEVLNNEIYQTIASTKNDVEGIGLYSIDYSSSMSVSGNKIYGLDGPANGYLSGINISGGTTSTGTIYNNAISINSVQSTLIDGIYAYGWGSTYNIYHNSVYIGGTEQGTNSSHAFFSTNSECVLNIKNNVFFNNRINNGGTGVHYAIHRYYTTGFVANYNDYFINGASSYIGKYNGSDVATLAAWRTATSQDANSISTDPLFTSTTNLKPITGTPLNLAGTPLTEVPKDINGTIRNVTTPTIGAYEMHATTWTGITSTDWNTVSNWSSEIPTTNMSVVIGTAPNNPQLSTMATVKDLTLNSGTVLSISANGHLTVSNTLANNAGTSGLVIKSDGTGTGTLISSSSGVQGKVQRILSCSKWHLISSPVSNAVSGMFMGNYLKYYNEATGGYVGINLSTIPLTPGKGYLYWNTGTGYAIKEYSSGTLNTGNISFSYTKTADGWNLSGNPYPSVLDWDVVSPTLPATVNGGVSMYDPITNTYKYYIMGGGAANTATQYVSPGQGFFVQATGSGTMTFTDAMRTHNGTPPFYKSASADQMLLLKISGNNITTQTAVRFGADATTGIDRLLDMCKIMEPTPQVPMLYTVCEGQKMVLNTLPLLYIKEGAIIPVYFEAGVGGSYQIEASEMGSIDPTISIYLEDVSRSYTQNLRLKPTYNFDYSTQGQARKMLIHFKNRKTGVDETGTIADGVQCYTSDNQLYVNFTPEVFGTKEGEANIEVYTLTGQQVYSRQTGSPTNQIELSTVAGAIYIVKVTYGNQVYVKKVIL
jgi:hypothetical protein